jgi:hypothetical protein
MQSLQISALAAVSGDSCLAKPPGNFALQP